MDDFENFEELFAFDPLFAYNEQSINRILKCRRSMEDELFVDRLLKTLGIQKAASDLYPPRSNQNLRDLHLQIIESPSPDHHKQSVLYYILKDIHEHDGRPASTFAKAVFLPERYRIFMDGIYSLDRAQFAKALDALTEPVLIPTFPEEIMYTLCTHPDQKDNKLPLAYYYTVTPTITSLRVLKVLFSVIAKANITEAFFWARRQGDPDYRTLFEHLINTVLEGNEGEDRARRSIELIHLPFSAKEELWFEAYLSKGNGRDLPGAEDTLSARKMVTGRSHDTAERTESGNGMAWSRLGSSFDRGSMAAR